MASVNNAMEEQILAEQQIEDEQQSDHQEVPAVSVMTDVSLSYISQLEEEVQRLREENQRLKDALEAKRLTKEAFKTFPSDKIRYFTRLPSLMRLMAVFSFIAPFVPDGSRSTLPQFQQFLMI